MPCFHVELDYKTEGKPAMKEKKKQAFQFERHRTYPRGGIESDIFPNLFLKKISHGIKSNAATFSWIFTRTGSPIRDLKWRLPLFKEHSSFNMIDTVSFTENFLYQDNSILFPIQKNSPEFYKTESLVRPLRRFCLLVCFWSVLFLWFVFSQAVKKLC